MSAGLHPIIMHDLAASTVDEARRRAARRPVRSRASRATFPRPGRGSAAARRGV